MFRDKRLSRRNINDWNRAAQRKQSLQELNIPDDPQSHWVWIRNDSGSARERFECMALSDPIFDLELDGSVDLMFKAIASSADGQPVILLEPIASGEFGKGIIHGLALAKVGKGSDEATVAGADDSYKLVPGGGTIRLLGKPSTTDDMLLPVLLGSNAVELYRFEMTEDIENGDGGETPPTTIITDFTKTKTITEEAILVNVDGMIDYARTGFKGECKLESGKYWFVQGACGQICKSATSIPKSQAPDDATIGQTDYAWTPTATGTVNSGSWSATGLPTGWACNSSTGEITGPTSGGGVAAPAGDVQITISCTGPKTSPATGNCTATRKFKVHIVAP